MTRPQQLLESLLDRLWRLVSSSPRRIIAVSVLSALLSGVCAIFFLGLDSNQDNLVSPDLPFQKTYLRHLENFGDQEYLYVVIQTDGSQARQREAQRFADRMADRLRNRPDLIQSIYYRVSADDFGESALLFASPEEAKTIAATVAALAPLADDYLKAGTLADLLDAVERLMSGGHASLSADPTFTGAALDRLVQLLDAIDGTLQGRPYDQSLFTTSSNEVRYFFSPNGRLLVMRLLPQKDYGTMEVIGEPLDFVRQALEATRSEFPQMEAGLTGRPVLQADEMQTTNQDMTRASIIDSILVGLFFMLILHGWLRPVLIMLCLGIALAWTFGFATLAVGRLNLLSMVFALVLVGIGVDYGVHMVMRYVEAEHGGLGEEAAVRTSIFHTGPGVVLGSVSTICGFYMVVGSDFQGLAELGLIAGTGILLCLLAMMVVLPSMLLVAGRRKLFPSSPPRILSMGFLERLSARPGRLLLILTLLSMTAIPGLFKLRFSYNLLELQSKGLESVQYEQLLINASGESTWYAIAVADSPAEVEQRVQAFQSLPTVGKTESILNFIPNDQELKIALYAPAAQALSDWSAFQAAPPSMLDAVRLAKSLKRLQFTLEALQEKVFAAGAEQEMGLLDRAAEHLASSLHLLENPESAVRLAPLQAQLYTSVQEALEHLRRSLTANLVTPQSLPESLRNLYIGKDGRYQIKITPSGDVWDFDQLERFVADLRQLDPQVSGVPVVVFESARLMHRTFLYAAGMTLLMVSLIVGVYSRSLRYVLLALLPLGTGLFWLLGLMGWLGLPFNLANFFAIPILIAIGIDGGVHLLDRWEEIRGNGALFETSTPTAVMSSFITTITGFGGLLMAHHRGMASLGAVMVLGSIMGMLACLLVLPATLKLLQPIAAEKERQQMKQARYLSLILLAAGILLAGANVSFAAETPMTFSIIQPGQPGTPEEAQPVMEALATYLQKKLGPRVQVQGRYFNVLNDALDALRSAPPQWGIVSLGFYAQYAEEFSMAPIASTRPGGSATDQWRIVVGKEAPDEWKALRGKVSGTMIFERDAAACLLFASPMDRLPFTLEGTAQPLKALRSVVGSRQDGIVLDRLQYESLKALPLSERIKIIHTSSELPTSPVVWFGPPREPMKALTDVLVGMRDDPEATGLLRLLQTEGFGPVHSDLPALRLGNGPNRCPR